MRTLSEDRMARELTKLDGRCRLPGVWVVEYIYHGYWWQLGAIFDNREATEDFIAERMKEHPNATRENFRVDEWAVHETWPPHDDSDVGRVGQG